MMLLVLKTLVKKATIHQSGLCACTRDTQLSDMLELLRYSKKIVSVSVYCQGDGPGHVSRWKQKLVRRSVMSLKHDNENRP